MPEQKRIFDPKQLDNLRSLHDHEECLRKESLAMLAADSARAEMLFLVTNAMGILFGFIHDTKARSDDELTIQYLGIRLFNAAAASIKLALSGYSQLALAQIRDVVEVAFLLDYFLTSPGEINVWRAADKKDRKGKFSPVRIRVALDERDGNKEKKRDKVYATLSEYATHATYAGFALTNKDGLGHVGPFVDERKLRVWTQEMALRLVPAACSFGLHFPDAPQEVRSLFNGFISQAKDWLMRGKE